MKLSLSKKLSLWGYAFLIIPLIYFIIVFLIPMVQAFHFSLLDYRTLSTARPFTGLDNYREVFHLEDFWKAMGNTLRYAVVRAPAVLIVGLVTALALQAIVQLKDALRTILMLPASATITRSESCRLIK